MKLPLLPRSGLQAGAMNAGWRELVIRYRTHWLITIEICIALGVLQPRPFLAKGFLQFL